MSTATLPYPSKMTENSGPLTPEHHQQLELGRQRMKKIQRAAKVANFNGWVTGFFALCSWPFAFLGPVSLCVAIGLTIVTVNEFRGRRRLLQLDPQAAIFLGWNQLGFLGLIIAYCVWMIYSGLTGGSDLTKQLQEHPELADVIDVQSLQSIFQIVVIAVYVTVIVLSIAFQGWNAYFYFTRRRMIKDYVRETPGWVCDLLKASGN